MLVTFSLPGREGPSELGDLDLIALAKLGVRGLALCLLVGVLVRCWHWPRRQLVFGRLLPAWLFLAWAFASVVWSPLKAVTLGQASSLLVLVLLSAALGTLWTGPRDTSALLFHLSLALLCITVLILAADRISHEWSGLNRQEHPDEGSAGLVHPTSAGATASLGLLLLVGSWLIWNWRWTRWLVGPGVVAHGLLFYLAASRTAWAMTSLVLTALVVFLAPRLWLAAGVLAVSVVGVLYLALDPTWAALGQGLDAAESVLTRGESAESLQSLTGRTELWEAVWKEYQVSPLIGHGYFVTSRTGLLDVWSGPSNRTAHNVFLQVLVSTGLIGLVLFLWAGANVVWSVVRSGWTRAGADGRLAFLVPVGLWYLGWSQLGESFMGPIQPEAVVFYGCLGLAMSTVGEAS
jgi:hypothetical protein